MKDSTWDLIIDVPCTIEEIADVDARIERIAARMELEEFGSGYGGGWRDYQFVLPPMTFSGRAALLQEANVQLMAAGLLRARASLLETTAAQMDEIERIWRARHDTPERRRKDQEKMQADWDAYQARKHQEEEPPCS